MSKVKTKVTPLPASAHSFEFAGPPGALVLTFGLPLICYALTMLCNDVSGCPVPSVLHPSTFSIDQLKKDVGYQGLSTFFNLRSMAAWIGWNFWLLALEAFLPSTTVPGTKLKTGGTLQYRMNTLLSAVVTVGLAGVGTLVYGADFVVWTFIWENYIPLMTSSIIISYALSWYVYYLSFDVPHSDPTENRELAKGGTSGVLIYDWFIGRELNPRITLPVFGTVDIKIFNEIRPGMIGWVFLDLAFCAQQYRAYQEVTDSIALITLFNAVYVFDCFYNEPAILTTMDITSDGFGFMLAFGDLVWLPFVYSLHARYLAIYPYKLGLLGIAVVLGTQAVGYTIFRLANNEKNVFRTNPEDPRVANLEYIETKAGSRLLVSGWWGRARHINYLGDLIMSLAWCLTTGLAGFVVQYSSPAPPSPGEMSPADGGIFGGRPVTKQIVEGEARGYGMAFTYFYMVYFVVLLVHRELRDEEKCEKKYGKDWEKYKEMVPYRILPGVY